jgi:hypothetical protein
MFLVADHEKIRSTFPPFPSRLSFEIIGQGLTYFNHSPTINTVKPANLAEKAVSFKIKT